MTPAHPHAPAAPDVATIEAVLVLADPTGPGRPWTPGEIADILPALCTGPSTPAVEATTARWLTAIASGDLGSD